MVRHASVLVRQRRPWRASRLAHCDHARSLPGECAGHGRGRRSRKNLENDGNLRAAPSDLVVNANRSSRQEVRLGVLARPFPRLPPPAGRAGHLSQKSSVQAATGTSAGRADIPSHLCRPAPHSRPGGRGTPQGWGGTQKLAAPCRPSRENSSYSVAIRCSRRVPPARSRTVPSCAGASRLDTRVLPPHPGRHLRTSSHSRRAWSARRERDVTRRQACPGRYDGSQHDSDGPIDSDRPVRRRPACPTAAGLSTAAGGVGQRQRSTAADNESGLSPEPARAMVAGVQSGRPLKSMVANPEEAEPDSLSQ